VFLRDVYERARTHNEAAQANNENCDNEDQMPHAPVNRVFPPSF
jgi:hypothetical protein